ncbi:MAG: hypothetical protein INR69_02910 [Mucilaginibacter polytrichastri]|nr:hypothetical protein [Mucilaginibacter polytrichastri]
MKKLAVVLAEIGQDKYEMQILKYFDMTAWIRKKFSHQRSGEEQKHVA